MGLWGERINLKAWCTKHVRASLATRLSFGNADPICSTAGWVGAFQVWAGEGVTPCAGWLCASDPRIRAWRLRDFNLVASCCRFFCPSPCNLLLASQLHAEYGLLCTAFHAWKVEIIVLLVPQTVHHCVLPPSQVSDVKIFEVLSAGYDPAEAVRIFVQFERVDSAIKGHIDLKGRFFGGKEVRLVSGLGTLGSSEFVWETGAEG